MTLCAPQLCKHCERYSGVGMRYSGGLLSGKTVRLTPMPFPKVLNAKHGNSMCHFSDLGMTGPGIEPRPTVAQASYYWGIDAVGNLVTVKTANTRVIILEKFHSYKC